MNVLDAAFHTVHDRKHGGSTGLAPRMGKTHQSLSAEVAGKPGFKFGLEDAMTVQHLTCDHRILYAMAAELGHLCVPLPAIPDGADAPCAAKLGKVAQDFGAYMGEVAQDVADNRISDNEMAQIERSWSELVASGQQLLKHLVAMNAATQPQMREGT